MTSSTISLTPEFERPKGLRRVILELKRNPIVIWGLGVVLFWIIIMLITPYIAPFEPLKQNLQVRLQPPASDHFFGTDELGRDIFSRVLYGSRVTIPASVIAIIVTSIIGSTVGAIAGYWGGIIDEIIMRITELFMAFPIIILAMAIAAALGANVKNLVIALIVVSWPNYARIMRGNVLSVKSKDFVEAAYSIGASHPYILLRTIVPNALSAVVVFATLDVGVVIISFAGLSFLGLGPEPTSPEWGRMVSIGIDFFDQWWMWLFPGMAIASLVLALNFVGDGLRDIIDPRLR